MRSLIAHLPGPRSTALCTMSIKPSMEGKAVIGGSSRRAFATTGRYSDVTARARQRGSADPMDGETKGNRGLGHCHHSVAAMFGAAHHPSGNRVRLGRPCSCGFHHQQQVGPLLRHPAIGASTRVREMKERSATAEDGAGETCSALRVRMLVRSRTVTRSSDCSRQDQLPVPTSTATTSQAPRRHVGETAGGGARVQAASPFDLNGKGLKGADYGALEA